MRIPFNGLTVSNGKEVVTNVTVQYPVQFRTFLLESLEIYILIFLNNQCEDDVHGSRLPAGQDGGVHEQHGELGGGDDGGLFQREKEN